PGRRNVFHKTGSRCGIHPSRSLPNELLQAEASTAAPSKVQILTVLYTRFNSFTNVFSPAILKAQQEENSPGSIDGRSSEHPSETRRGVPMEVLCLSNPNRRDSV